jgi:hypothetical protein
MLLYLIAKNLNILNRILHTGAGIFCDFVGNSWSVLLVRMQPVILARVSNTRLGTLRNNVVTTKHTIIHVHN